MKTHQLTQHIFSAGVICLLIASAFFFLIWYTQYLRFEFNALGRYYDVENQIVYTDAGFVWCLPAFGLLFTAIGLVTVRYRRHRKKSSNECCA